MHSIFPSSKIYCEGELLHDVQMAGLYTDSKTFVDFKVKGSIEETLHKYKTLKNEYDGKRPPNDILLDFVNNHFAASSEMEIWDPPDWNPQPPKLQQIQDKNYRKFAHDLNSIWKILGRRTISDVKQNTEKYSQIYLPEGFIVPGGRFSEMYYWDTYWIANGLLICGMTETVKGIIKNMLHLVNLIGHIPNGSRVYYEKRSQPPMLIPMVESYINETNDIQFLFEILPILDKEMNFWLNNRLVDVKLNKKKYPLFRFNADTPGPRPESYREDLHLAAGLSESDRNSLYTALKSGAESGWDFSTRWFIFEGENRGSLSNIATQYIIPVDLNSIIHKCFSYLYQSYTSVGDEKMAGKYGFWSKTLLHSINQVLWHDHLGTWLDYNIKDDKPRTYFYLSNLTPLWTMSYDMEPTYLINRILNYLNLNKFHKYRGGLPTSSEFSGEQWDFPNSWPPLQSFVILGLDKFGTIECSQLAWYFADLWLHSNFVGFRNHGVMYEKYDSLKVGVTGEGGEYEGQFGFGWTNGVIFELIYRFASDIRAYNTKVHLEPRGVTMDVLHHSCDNEIYKYLGIEKKQNESHKCT